MSKLTTSTKDSPLQFSVNQCCNPDWQLDETLHEYRRWGITKIGLWRHQLSRFGIEKSIDLIQESKLEISSISWIGGFTGGLGTGFEQAIKDAHHWLWVARELGVKTLIVKTGPLCGHIHSHANRLVIQGLKRILPKAERLNIQLALMPVDPLWGKEWSFLFEFKEALKLVRQCSSSHLGICFNTFHMISENSPPIDWQEFAQYVNLVQISDRDISTFKGPLGCLPGAGYLPIFEFLEQRCSAECATPIELCIEQGNDQKSSLDVTNYLEFARTFSEIHQGHLVSVPNTDLN